MPQAAYEAYDPAGYRKYLTLKEGRAFLQHAGRLEKRERVLCELLYYVGCRPSESITIKPIDIDLSELKVRIVTLKQRGKFAVRRIPIPGHLAVELSSLGEPDELLWPYSRMKVWRIVKKVMNAAEIKGRHACPKGLRHGFGVRSVFSKVPLHLIQRWMGHSCATTTAIYLAVMDAEERELMESTWHLPESREISPCGRATAEGRKINVTVKISEQLCRKARHLAVDAGIPSLSKWLAGLIQKEASRSLTEMK